MIRLFVGVELPPAMRDALLAAMHGVAGARWQRDDQLHLTLRFIGEVDRHQAADIAAVLAQVRIEPMMLALASPGSFDRRGRIDSLWIGITPREKVVVLAQRVNQALHRVGVAPEQRAFVPHITVARLGRDAGSVVDFLASRPSPQRHEIKGFALFESCLGSGGSTYRIVERYAGPMAVDDTRT